MKEIIQSICPLCDTSAQYEHHDANLRRYYKCDICKYYVITETAIKHLIKYPESVPALAEAVKKMPHETEILDISIQGRTLHAVKVSRSKYSK